MTTKQKTENVDGWYRSSIRRDVINSSLVELPGFISWKSRCLGKVVIQRESIPSDDAKIPKLYIYFECEEDLVSYLLTFDEIPKWPDGDAAFYYAPYVPLTFSGVNAPNLAPAGSVFFNTRHGTITVYKDDVDASS